MVAQCVMVAQRAMVAQCANVTQCISEKDLKSDIIFTISNNSRNKDSSGKDVIRRRGTRTSRQNISHAPEPEARKK